jgi:hypothetical protein
MAVIGKLFLLYLGIYGNMYIILANQAHGKKEIAQREADSGFSREVQTASI